MCGLAAAGGPRLVHPLSTGAGRDVALAPGSGSGTGTDETTEALVPPDSTLQSLLVQAQLPADLASSIVAAARTVFNPRNLRADRPYRITRSIDGLFREFRYDIDADNFLRVVFQDTSGTRAASFDAAIVVVPKEYETAAVSAVISRNHRSIIDAFNAEGENIQLPLQLAEIFGGELDFNADLKMGDRVDVLFDRAMRSGEFVGYGSVNAAVLHAGARSISAVRVVDADGQSGWYDEHGHSLKRQFLKSPLPFDPRVTSGFSSSRMHPILGMARPHLGVDFGAPYGTAVKAVAAGVVEIAGIAGDAGRMIRLRHAGGYETAYLHLSSFGLGIHPGARVEQGEVIGRVGDSGLATGPHLDYRIIRKGVYVNPLTEFSHTPLDRPIAPDAMAAFATRRDSLLRDLLDRIAAGEPAP
jgi:murein DD-endopeptidase MepM/ murein hydrolase activator NlpD